MFGLRQHRIYTVHINPLQSRPYESARFIEEGFSFLAFLFTGVWALYHKLWWPMLGIIAANLLILRMHENGMITLTGQSILQLGLHCGIGFLANDWLRARLARTGYILSDIVTGDSLLRAEQRYYDRYFADATAPHSA